MDRQERIRRFRNVVGGGNQGEKHRNGSPKRPTRVDEPLGGGASRRTPSDDEFNNLMDFEPGDVSDTLEVSPDGTQRATRRTRQGNASTVLAQTQHMYNDRESERKIRQQMKADEMAYTTQMQRMRQDYKVTRDRMRAEMAEAKRAAEEERIRQRQEAELRRERLRLDRDMEHLRMMEEARQRREEAKVRREMEAARRAAQEAADKRRHEREMYVLNNTPDMAERLTNTRIRQTESIMKQAQDRVRFQDERNREYVGKIKVEKMQRGERFDKDIEVLFEQFGLDAPSIESMKRPSVTEEIRLGTCKNRHYVYSRLFTGVRRLHQADNNGYVEFMNGDRMTLPGTAEGLLATVVEVMPYVYMIHVYYYDPEYLASLGYQINKNPFDCCKNMFGCTIQ